jgi:hypothetical protein
MRIIDTGRSDKPLILPDNARGLCKAQTGLRTIRSGKYGLTARTPLRPNRMQEVKCGCE